MLNFLQINHEKYIYSIKHLNNDKLKIIGSHLLAEQRI